MIGKRVRQRREELGMSQEELALKCGYKSRSSINKIELNINDVTQSKVQRIADALDVDPVWLLKDDSSPDAFTDEETAIIMNYREADTTIQVAVKTLLKISKSMKEGDSYDD